MNKFGSLNIKIAIFLTGVMIAILVLFYTQIIVKRIQQRETQIASLYAKSLEYVAKDESVTGEYNFIFNEIIQKIDFPIILTDKDYKNADVFINLELDTAKLTPKEKNDLMVKEAREMAEINTPIKVTMFDTIILRYVNYGQSNLITQLRFFPIVEFFIGGLFVLFGYIGFSYIKKTEQSNIWVGLSRETAHQLGTPLSSLNGWIEILKNTGNISNELRDISFEIEKDVDKLSKIAGRFSKIGSLPELRLENLYDVIKNVTIYFEKRIPTLTTIDGKKAKKVQVRLNSQKDIFALVNRDLFEWVIENLLKNALDAIDKPIGSIVFTVQVKEKEIFIDVNDNGKGIDKKFKKDVFRPGYSTKKRGWGLGLSLSKRIMEDYHKGKLIVLDSIPGQGTTFRIKLNK
ncbi:MAG TPA: HAMP domain-containing sensor histidine kinase [Ignavibacteria bacterium]